MNTYYERKWDIVDEIDIDLFDGNLVRVQWLERETLEELAPAQIRILTTAYSNPRRLKRFTTLSPWKNYGPGWELVVMESLGQVSERLKQTRLDTFDAFISTLFGCFKAHWSDPPDFPVAVSVSELNEFYTNEAIDSAVSYFLGGPHDEDFDMEFLSDWGDQRSNADTDLDDEEME